VEQIAVDTGPHLIDYIGLQVDVDCSRNVLSLAYIRRKITSECKHPSPRRASRSFAVWKGGCGIRHTSLGEESAESLILRTVLTFFGQVSIGLQQKNVSELPKDQSQQVHRDVIDKPGERISSGGGFRTWMPCSRQYNYNEIVSTRGQRPNSRPIRLTSQQELAIWQPAWPTVFVTRVSRTPHG
jgi:hypothetical protein